MPLTERKIPSILTLYAKLTRHERRQARDARHDNRNVDDGFLFVTYLLSDARCPSEISFTRRIKNLSRDESKRTGFYQENKKAKHIETRKKQCRENMQGGKIKWVRRERNFVRKGMSFSVVYTIHLLIFWQKKAIVRLWLASLTRKLNGPILRKCTLFPVAPQTIDSGMIRPSRSRCSCTVLRSRSIETIK